jgi:putative hemolysin
MISDEEPMNASILSYPNVKRQETPQDLDLRAGNLEVLVASRKEDIEAAQALRYRVWVEEIGAKVAPEMHLARREWDEFDAFCDHLLVVEHQPKGPPKVVGTYRLMRREGMRRCGRFYSASEFDISAIDQYPGEVMELGRTSVDSAYRNRAVMQLLWRGIGAYVTRFDVELLFGCASLSGIDPSKHAMSLAYLHHYHLAPEKFQLKALPERFVDMNLMPKDQVDVKDAFLSLPALIKGYLRLGGYIGLGAVIDREYNTTDVSIVVRTDLVTDKYVQRYYGKPVDG